MMRMRMRMKRRMMMVMVMMMMMVLVLVPGVQGSKRSKRSKCAEVILLFVIQGLGSMLPAASPVQDTMILRVLVCARGCVCVCLLCPLFLRVSLPSIYSFLSLFVCYWLLLVVCSFRIAPCQLRTKHSYPYLYILWTLVLENSKSPTSDHGCVRAGVRLNIGVFLACASNFGSLERGPFGWFAFLVMLHMLAYAQHGGLGALITFLTSLREGPRNLLPLLTCCTRSLMLNTGAGWGLITFLTPLRQGPRNLELTGSTDVPTRPVPQVSNPKGGRVVDEMWLLCSPPISPCPHVRMPMSHAPIPTPVPSLGLFKWYFCQFGRTVSKTSRTISKCVQDHS